MSSEQPKSVSELIQFKIVEKPYEVKVPKFVEVEVEVPKYKEKEYELPVLKEVVYEKPVIKEKDLTEGLRQLIRSEIEKGIAEVIQGLKISMEIPLARVLQVRPGGKVGEVSG